MAGAEEAVIVALMRDRDAAEMGADADHHQPLLMAVLGAGLVGCGIGQARHRNLTDLVDLLLAAMADVDRLAAPEHLDVLPFGDGAEIDLDRRAGRDRRGIRIHLGNERPECGQAADRCCRACGDEQEVSACRMIRCRRCHDSYPFMNAAVGTAPLDARTLCLGVVCWCLRLLWWLFFVC